eukprot:scaffold2047_cov129-Cylindrotheca_fusiformis.AAC.39
MTKSPHVIGATSVVLFVASALLYRGRKKSQFEAESAENAVAEGPMVGHLNQISQERIDEKAKSRVPGEVSSKIADANRLSGQVGGLSGHKHPLLRLPPYVLKPLREDFRRIREIYFYEASKMSTREIEDHPPANGGYASRLFETLDSLAVWIALRVLHDPYVVDWNRRMLNAQEVLQKHRNLLTQLQPFLPEYFGVLEQSSLSPTLDEGTQAKEKSDISYLVLEDTTAGYVKPCILDVKMGPQSYEPDADQEKQQKEREKYPPMAEFGLRVVGMRVLDPSHKDAREDGFVFYSKHYWRSQLELEKVKDGIRAFFGAGETEKSISSVLSQLREIQLWFLRNDSFRFYASSLLICYEGGKTGEDCAQPTVKMIDFGRVRRNPGGDDGYLLGLKTLTTMIEEILVEVREQA